MCVDVQIEICWLGPHSPLGPGRRARDLPACCIRRCVSQSASLAQPSQPSQPSPAQPSQPSLFCARGSGARLGGGLR